MQQLRAKYEPLAVCWKNLTRKDVAGLLAA
jgi:hypothetical protein